MWQVIIMMRTCIELNTSLYMTQVRLFAEGKSSNLCISFNFYKCLFLCFLISDSPRNEGVLLWLKSQVQVQKDAALVVRAEEQQCFSDVIFSVFLFCSSQIHTIIHTFLRGFVHGSIVVNAPQSSGIQHAGTKDVQGQCFQYPF